MLLEAKNSLQKREEGQKLSSSLKSGKKKKTENETASHIITPGKEAYNYFLRPQHNCLFGMLMNEYCSGFCQNGKYQCCSLPTHSPEVSSCIARQRSTEDLHSTIGNAMPKAAHLCVDRIQEKGCEILYIHVKIRIYSRRTAPIRKR
jgi:hypothetical protein